MTLNLALTFAARSVPPQPLCVAQARSEPGSEYMMKIGLWNLGLRPSPGWVGWQGKSEKEHENTCTEVKRACGGGKCEL